MCTLLLLVSIATYIHPFDRFFRFFFLPRTFFFRETSLPIRPVNSHFPEITGNLSSLCQSHGYRDNNHFLLAHQYRRPRVGTDDICDVSSLQPLVEKYIHSNEMNHPRKSCSDDDKTSSVPSFIFRVTLTGQTMMLRSKLFFQPKTFWYFFLEK